jgi:hypothetical protein
MVPFLPMGVWIPKLRLRLPALILLAVTVCFWSLYDRYEAAAPVLLANPALDEGIHARGEITVHGDGLRLHVDAPGYPARIDFPADGALEHELIRVRGRIRVDGVVPGKYSWNCARLLILQYDAANKWIPGHHGVVAESGTADWSRHEDVFGINPRAVRVAVVLQQIGKAGTAYFDQIEAQPVRVKTSFKIWRTAFVTVWLWMAVLYFRRCRLHQRRLKLLILLNALAILAGTLMPGEWIMTQTERVKETARDWTARGSKLHQAASPAKTDQPAEAPVELQIDWFKQGEVELHQIGHFVLFAILCFLVYLSAALERQHPAYYVKVGLDVLLFAAITESLQYLTRDRTAGVADLRIDLYGMIFALLLFCLVRPLVRRIASRPS